MFESSKFLKLNIDWIYFFLISSNYAWSCLFFKVIKALYFYCSHFIVIMSPLSLLIYWFKTKIFSPKLYYLFLLFSWLYFAYACNFSYCNKLFRFYSSINFFNYSTYKFNYIFSLSNFVIFSFDCSSAYFASFFNWSTINCKFIYFWSVNAFKVLNCSLLSFKNIYAAVGITFLNIDKNTISFFGKSGPF